MSSYPEQNPQYARGMMQAAAVEAANVRNVFAALLKAFPPIERDAFVSMPSSFDRYMRAHNALRKAAEACALLGDDVAIPERLPERPATKMIKIEAPKEGGSYKETRGRGKSGEGLPPQMLLNDATAWLETYVPGVTKAS